LAIVSSLNLKNYEDSQYSLRSKSNKLNLSYGINFGLFLAI